MQHVTRIRLDRSVDRLGRRRKRKLTARQEFLQAWRSYGNRIARLLMAAYQSGEGRLTVNVRARLLRLRKNRTSGEDDLIELTISLNVSGLAADEIVLKHYENLSDADLFSHAAAHRAHQEPPCPADPPAPND